MTFFRFVEMEEIKVLDWSYLKVEYGKSDPDFLFQVDTFVVDSTVNATKIDFKIDPNFDLNDSTQKHRIYTQQGNRLNGKIESLTNAAITLKMEDGSLVRLDKIRLKRWKFIG